MNQISVEFDFKEKTYKGFLSLVSGGGASLMFHLIVDGIHWGQLSFVGGPPGFKRGLHRVTDVWRFHSNSYPELSELADFFGNIVERWYE